MTDSLARQGEVRAEAEAVLAELGLTERLATAGEPTVVGSAALGLMVRRDLDLWPWQEPSFEVYRAVLDHGISGIEAFDAWRLSGRPKP
ncbi:hypothetical protein M8C13_33090 [Crossiella sp. SN42]|uniref:hypothetical protein n=1 Tax=Crossiella sp. SN42 TaxID=2944808 RepID=UPI00207C9B94|nr:hypothetical protein [Crossiella sp. SN42]MCO1580603.1 hypothetical protein [Crossiella sp. SN42]